MAKQRQLPPFAVLRVLEIYKPAFEIYLGPAQLRNFALPHAGGNREDHHEVQTPTRRTAAGGQKQIFFLNAKIADTSSRLFWFSHLAYRVVVAPTPIFNSESKNVGERREVTHDRRRASVAGPLSISGG